MSRPRSLPAAFAMLLILMAAPLAAASGFLPPDGADRLQVGDVEVAHWASDNGFDNVTQELEAGAAGSLWFGIPNEGNVTQDNGTFDNVTRLVAYVNITPTGFTVENTTLVLESDPRVSLVWVYANTPFQVPGDATGEVTYAFTVELHEESANGTVLLGTEQGSGTLAVQEVVIPTPPEPGFPVVTALAAGAAVLVVGGAGAYALRQRSERKRIAAAPRRSQAMREAALDRQLEKAKKPEDVQRVQQEIRQQEKVREGRRELQILEAKRADAVKTLDLLKKRREMGGITEHQYKMMVQKKQADLDRIEAEIREMEREGGESAAA